MDSACILARDIEIVAVVSPMRTCSLIRPALILSLLLRLRDFANKELFPKSAPVKAFQASVKASQYTYIKGQLATVRVLSRDASAHALTRGAFKAPTIA